MVCTSKDTVHYINVHVQPDSLVFLKWTVQPLTGTTDMDQSRQAHQLPRRNGQCDGTICM